MTTNNFIRKNCYGCGKEVENKKLYKGLFCSSRCEREAREALRSLISKPLITPNPRKG
jgi:hypothetical protein